MQNWKENKIKKKKNVEEKKSTKTRQSVEVINAPAIGFIRRVMCLNLFV